MSLAFNIFADNWKQKAKEVHGDLDFVNNRLRASESFQDFVLTAAQMDTLNATPVTVLAAPGSGLINIVTGIFLAVNATGFTRFELGSGVLEFRYTDGSGSKVVTDVTNVIVESATDLLGWNPAIVCAPLANAVVVAHASADVTAGTGNIQGRLFYKTIQLSEIV